jgi:class 3 adenylate cyclase
MRYAVVPVAGASAVTLALLLFDATHPAHVGTTFLRSLIYSTAITVLAGVLLPRSPFACGRGGPVAFRALTAVVVSLVCAVVGTFAGGVVLLLLGLDTRAQFWSVFGFSVRIAILMTFTLGVAMLAYEAFRERLDRLDRLKRFFSAPLAELIVNGQSDDLLRSQRREVTVVVLDLRGFTAFAEAAEPEDVMRVLHEYHGAMGKLVLQWDATLERFTGDGMMIFFNDLVPVENPAERAVRMALEMRDRLEDLRVRWHERGYDLDFGVGIAQGYATIGMIGFEGRFDYGVIGTVTNLASRLCGEATAGRVLVSQRVLAAVGSLFDTEPIGDLTLKGFSKPVRAFTVVCPSPRAYDVAAATLMTYAGERVRVA